MSFRIATGITGKSPWGTQQNYLAEISKTKKHQQRKMLTFNNRFKLEISILYGVLLVISVLSLLRII